MKGEILYMLGVIGVGFLVNYTLRALPFLLFAGRDRKLPVWVERLGGILSPIIIAGLIVYAYSGSQWRTAWPYVAGAVTVLLQVWKRNPLVSIVAGTLVYMLLVNCCGCATTQTVVSLDAAHPELRLASDGVYMGSRRVPANKIVEALEEAAIPKDRAIHILMDRDLRDLRSSRALMALLARGGYTRSLVITHEHGESRNRSGDRYAGSERLERRDDVDFYVCGKGVTYGRMLRLDSPAEVAQCLKMFGIGRDRLIRLNYQGSERRSAAGDRLKVVLYCMKKLLREEGYANVRLVDIETR